MITSKDVKLELKKAQEKIKGDENQILLKILEVLVKITLSNRLNLVKIMEKLEIEKIKPQVTNNEKEKTEK